MWLIIFLLQCCLLLAQETFPVVQAYHLQWPGSSSQAGPNGKLIAWIVSSNHTKILYAQLISNNGERVWASDLQLAQSDGYLSIKQIVTSSNGNYLVVCTTNRSLIGYVITPLGTNLFPSPIIVVDNCGYLYGLQVLPEQNEGFSYLYVRNQQLCLKRLKISLDGPVLSAERVLILDRCLYLTGACQTSSGDMILNVEHDINHSTRDRIYKFSPNGDLIGNGQLLPDDILPYPRFTLLADNEGYYYIYAKPRSYYCNLYIYKFSAAGVIPGEEVTCLDTYDLEPGSFTIGVYSGCYYYTSISQINYPNHLSIYKLNRQGQMEWNEARRIYGHTVTIDRVELREDAMKRIWVIWGAHNTTEGRSINLTLLDTGGRPLWYAPFSANMGDAEKDDCAFWGSGEQMCLVWKNTTDSLRLESQAITADKILLQPHDNVTLTSLPRGNNINKAVFATNGNVICIWEKSYTSYSALYYQVFNSSLQPVLDPQGVKLCPERTDACTLHKTLLLPSGKVALLYSLANDDAYTHYLQLIAPDGSLEYPGNGLVLNYLGDQNNMFVFGNDLVVTWHRGVGGQQFHVIQGQKYVDGVPVWPGQGNYLALIMNSQQLSCYTMVGNYLVWEETNDQTQVTYATKLDAYGAHDLTWQPLQVDNAVNRQFIKAGLMGDDLVIISSGISYDLGTYVLYAEKVNSLGEKPWGETGVILYQFTPFYYTNSIALQCSENKLTTMILDLPQYLKSSLKLVELDSAGNGIWGVNGLTVYDRICWGVDLDCHITDNGTYVAFYIDYSGYLNQIKFLTFNLNIVESKLSVLPVFSGSEVQENYLLASENNYSYVVWEDVYGSSNEGSRSLLGARIDHHVSNTGVEDVIALAPGNVRNIPNPFHSATTISFDLDKPSQVSIQIYNIKGQKVATLASKQDYSKGKNSLVWDGRDQAGNTCASGVYFYHFKSNSEDIVGKMLRIK